MKIHNVEQRTEEWYALRNQYPLSSSKAQAIGNAGKGLETLVWEKMAERYSIADKDQYTNKDLDRGIELEPQARSIYELKTGNVVTEVGFVTNDKISKVGGTSTDGLINEDGVLEIKCFEDKKHFQYIVDGLEIESQYEWQCQMELLITGKDYCDFVAYNPNFKESLLIVRTTADKEKREAILEGLKKGEKIIKEIETKLK